ncbi:MAG: hypothetical protein ACJARE_002828, partial [Paracoccaceae bacterium]
WVFLNWHSKVSENINIELYIDIIFVISLIFYKTQILPQVNSREILPYRGGFRFALSQARHLMLGAHGSPKGTMFHQPWPHQICPSVGPARCWRSCGQNRARRGSFRYFQIEVAGTPGGQAAGGWDVRTSSGRRQR